MCKYAYYIPIKQEHETGISWLPTVKLPKFSSYFYNLPAGQPEQVPQLYQTPVSWATELR